MKKTIQMLVCLTLLTTTIPALAEMPEQDVEKQLNVQVFASSDDPVKTWFETKPPKAPQFSMLNEVEILKPFHIAILVGGLALDKDGHYKGTVDVKITQPDGAALMDEKNYSVIEGTAPEKYKQYLGAYKMVDPGLMMGMEGSDPKGEYLIEAIIHDEVGENQTRGEYKITLK